MGTRARSVPPSTPARTKYPEPATTGSAAAVGDLGRILRYRTCGGGATHTSGRGTGSGNPPEVQAAPTGTRPSGQSEQVARPGRGGRDAGARGHAVRGRGGQRLAEGRTRHNGCIAAVVGRAGRRHGRLVRPRDREERPGRWPQHSGGAGLLAGPGLHGIAEVQLAPQVRRVGEAVPRPRPTRRQAAHRDVASRRVVLLESSRCDGSLRRAGRIARSGGAARAEAELASSVGCGLRERATPALAGHSAAEPAPSPDPRDRTPLRSVQGLALGQRDRADRGQHVRGDGRRAACSRRLVQLEAVRGVACRTRRCGRRPLASAPAAPAASAASAASAALDRQRLGGRGRRVVPEVGDARDLLSGLGMWQLPGRVFGRAMRRRGRCPARDVLRPERHVVGEVVPDGVDGALHFGAGRCVRGQHPRLDAVLLDQRRVPGA